MKNNPHLLDGLSSMTPSHHISILRSKLITCLAHGSLMLFPPVVLALALISLELEQFTSVWFPTIVALQKMVQVRNLVPENVRLHQEINCSDDNYKRWS